MMQRYKYQPVPPQKEMDNISKVYPVVVHSDYLIFLLKSETFIYQLIC